MNLGKGCQKWGTRTRSPPVAPSPLPLGECGSSTSGLKSCCSPGDGPVLPGRGQSPGTDLPGRSETHTAPRVTPPLFLLPPASSGLSTAALGCSAPSRVRQEQTRSERDTRHVSAPTQDLYAGKSNFCISNARNFL